MLSALMRLQPHPVMVAWVAAQPRAMLYITSVNKAEILYGIAALPEGQRRTALAVAAEAILTEDLADRILPFDSVAAVHYAEIVTTRRRAGTPIEAFDAQVAATRPWRSAPMSRRAMSAGSKGVASP